MAVLVALIIFFSVILIIGAAGSHNTMTDRSFSINYSYPLYGNMYIDNDGTVYAKDNDAIVALAADGKLKWRLPIVDHYIYTGATDENGTVYLACEWELLAVSSTGELKWKQPLVRYYNVYSLSVIGDRLYLRGDRGDSRIDIYDSHNGSWEGDIMATFRPSFDADGDAYNGSAEPDTTAVSEWKGEIVAHDTSGLLWRQEINSYSTGIIVFEYSQLWIMNDQLMVTDNHCLAALDFDGNLLWRINISPSYILAGFDSSSHIYFARYDWENGSADFEIICQNASTDRLNESVHRVETGKDNFVFCDGVVYYAKKLPGPANRTLDELDTYAVYAYDLPNDTILWTREIQSNRRKTMLDESSLGKIMFNMEFSGAISANNTTEICWSQYVPESEGVNNRSVITITVDDNVVYVSYWAYNYVAPFILNQSVCAYAGGIYALDDTGRIVLSKQTDAYVKSMTAVNGTVYYWTDDGRFSSTSVGIVAGFVLAAFYLVFRFLLLGAVSRARARVNENENRARLLNFIARSPGATVHEMARSLCMNIGTVRYHLFILSVSHKVKASDDGEKYVRYFVNNNRYSDEEMQVLSLMRRDHMGQLINILMSSPGASNTEISQAMGIPDSAVSRYLRDLADRGVVEKRRMENGRLCYMLEERVRDAIDGLGLNDSAAVPVAQTSQAQPGMLAVSADH